jgi:SAM-dependent methyltransferase/DNA-directed RNA polymerase subunit RPC12/RpoP
MDESLQKIIICPNCGSEFNRQDPQYWICGSCGLKIIIQNGKPVFTPIPQEIIPSEKLDRSADSGSRWRQANWKFVESQLSTLDAEAIILDIGAGRGDFSELFAGKKYLALEIYPYPEIDLVCDLSLCVPFGENTFDCVTLLNVCEHVPDPKTLLTTVFRLLKPGGQAVITIPFLLKIHQAPVDYARYTHFALEKMGKDIGFEISLMEGFYDPAGLIGETARYYRFWELPNLNSFQRIIARLFLSEISVDNFFLELISGRGHLKNPHQTNYPAPTGYHIVFKKPSEMVGL